MKTSPLARAFIDGMMAEMASTVSALTGHAATVVSGEAPTGAAWVVTLRVSGAHRGTASLALDGAGTEALARDAMGPDADVSQPAIARLIRELVEQAAGALGRQSAFSGMTVAVDAIDTGSASGRSGVAHTIVMGEGHLHVTAAAEIETPGRSASVASEPDGRAAIAPSTSLATTTPSNNWDVLLDIDLPLRVRFGATEMSIRSLSALGPGSLLDMGRAPEDPVEIVVCGRVIARAEVVVVDGNYGVRVTDLLSATERVRALEAQL